METYANIIISFLISPSFDGPFGIIRLVFIAVFIILAVSTIILTTKSSYLQASYIEDTSELLTFKPHGAHKITKAWDKTKARLETGLESEYKLAVIEGDSILDDVLKKMGYKGENLVERLDRLTSATLPNIEDIKESHKARTNILHSPDYNLTLDEAKKILAVYEKALESLQAF
jgi:hypothetical protein